MAAVVVAAAALGYWCWDQAAADERLSAAVVGLDLLIHRRANLRADSSELLPLQLLLLQLFLLLLKHLLLVQIHHHGCFLYLLEQIHVMELQHLVVLARRGIWTKARYSGEGTASTSKATQGPGTKHGRSRP